MDKITRSYRYSWAGTGVVFAILGARILLIVLCICTMGDGLSAYAYSRIKDIVFFEGVRDNMLVGYGLVVGLDGTGDNLRNAGFTGTGLVDYLKRLGVNTQGAADFKTRNIAAVIVTATLPPFASPGYRISVNVSTLGDAHSLKGGTLLASQLFAPNGQVYALAQGPVSLGVLADQGAAMPVAVGRQKAVLTSGYVMGGGIVERSTDFDLNALEDVRISLRNADITTARAIAIAINAEMRSEVAIAENPGTVRLLVPARYKNNVVGLLADIESIPVEADSVAKVVIDEATGTVVFGENVRLNTVAIAQAHLVVKIDDTEESELFPQTQPHVQMSAPGTRLGILKETASLGDLVQGLNTLGVKPADLIAILKTVQQAGALQASIETR